MARFNEKDAHSSGETVREPSPVAQIARVERDDAAYPHVKSNDFEKAVNSARHSISSGSSVTVNDESQNENERPDLERTITQKLPPVKVERSKRRGLFARFVVVAEITEPTDYPNKTKWMITMTIAIAGAAAPVGSAIILPALGMVARDLHSTPTITNLSVALYMLSMAIFPLWWSAFSERLGRRTIYLTSFAMFIVFGVLAAISRSVGMLVVMRLLNGGGAASVQAVGAGTIADIWEPRERGRAMGTFYLGPLCGPLLAPIVGGVLAESLGWRSTQWALVIYGGLAWIGLFFLLPETLKVRKSAEVEAESETTKTVRPTLSRTSTREAVQQTSKKYIKMFRILFIDPLSVLAYLRFPAVVLTVYYAAVTFGSLYLLNISVQYTFERPPYGFKTIIVGLLYIPNSIGYILASLFGGRWMDKIMAREARKANRVTPEGKLIYRPEDRMRENAWLGALIYPAALLVYGWTADKGVFWLVPMIANFFYGIGSMLIFAMTTTMLTEFMPHRSSSGVAVNNLIRNIFSCVGALVGAPLIKAIGDGWLFTIVSIWTLCSCIVIWAMKRYGPRWRLHMEEAIK